MIFFMQTKSDQTVQMRRLIRVFAGFKCHFLSLAVPQLKYNMSWSTTKNDKMTCVPSEDLDQPGHPPSLIRVFTVRLRKPLVLIATH